MAGGILDRLDDAINPIVVKELRQAVKSRLVVSALLLFLLLEVVILGACLMFREVRSPDGVDYQAGQLIFVVLQAILLGVCLILVPAYAGIRLAAERSDTNVDLLFISTLKPRSIIWGKFLAAVVLVLLIFSACAPFMTFTYLLRGLDIPSILLILLMDFLVVLAATMLAVFIAAVPAHRGVKGGMFLLAFGGLVFVFFMAMAASVQIIEQRGMMRMDTGEFWAMVAAIAAAVLCEMGQYFVWSVALVSPPSANRALSVRLYTAMRCLLSLGAFGGIAYMIREPMPIYVWQWLTLGLAILQMTISISERDHWGPRVTRMIPRRGSLRCLAFVFYSGAAGGIIFSLLMVVLALVVGPLLVEWLMSRWRVPPGNEHWHHSLIMLIAALYSYAYAMLAVLCRRTLFAQRLKSSFTWLLWMILVALGSALPYIFLLTIPKNSLNFERDNPWILLTNPIASAISAAYANEYHAMPDFDNWCLIFVTAMACLLTLANLTWFFSQMRAFRPLKRQSQPIFVVPLERMQEGTAPILAELLPNVAIVDPPPEAVAEPGGVHRARHDGQV
jgi:ABC-type transport system involved in multi-copper enzyme maturation permease subunit